MARKTQTILLDKQEISVTQMDADRALRAQIYLTKVLSPFFNDLQKLTADTALDILPKILEQIDDERFYKFFIEMCEEAFINTEKVNFNKNFSGDLKKAYQCFLFVIKVNFADFIKDVLGVDIEKSFNQVASK